MARHVTYRGVTIDMDSMRRENEKVPALGNMKVNARGDELGKNSTVTKTADQLARENHRVQTSIVNTGLKGAVPASPETIKPIQPTAKAVPAKKQKEKELPTGDIVMEDDNDEA